jgi:hypothetical protein
MTRTKHAFGALVFTAATVLAGAGVAQAHEGEPIAPGPEETEEVTTTVVADGNEESKGMPSILLIGAIGAIALAGGAVVASKLTGKPKTQN